jgi:mannose-6-phosphate isomerase class I
MRFSLLTAALFLITTHAHAGIEQQLAGCAAKTDKLDRLLCYDKLAQSVGQVAPQAANQEAAQTVVSVTSGMSQTQAMETPSQERVEDAFGMKQKPVDAIERLDLEVAAVKKDAYGVQIISFSNGQVWKQIETRRFKLEPGQRVYIEAGALGSFLLGSEDRNSTVRVKRLK